MRNLRDRLAGRRGMAAVGDHGGGDGGLGGMVISRGGEIATPCDLTRLLPAAVGMEQQRAIAAAHHAEAELHKADGAVAQVMALPGPPGDRPGRRTRAAAMSR